MAAAVAASNADLLDLTAVVAPVLEGATVDDAVGSGDGLVGKLDTVATLIDADGAVIGGGTALSDAAAFANWKSARRLVERGCVIGVAMDAWMLYPDWQIGKVPRDAVSLEAVTDHLDHICQLAGNCHHAGIGSDLDGGYGTEQTPYGLDTIGDLQKIAELLARRGYGDSQIDRIFHGNWLEFFGRHLPPGNAEEL